MAARRRKISPHWESGDAKREQPGTCAVSGKRMYPNEAEAKSTAAHRMADKETAPAHLKTYRCLYCGTWHLTSKQA